MPDIAVEWNKQDVANLERVIRTEIDLMRKEPAEAVRHAFIMFGKTGRNRTRKGRKLRDYIVNPNRRKRSGIKAAPGVNRRVIAQRRAAKGRPDDPANAWAPFLVRFLYQSRAPKYVGVTRKRDPIRTIGRRHMARLTWGLMMRNVYNGTPASWPGRLKLDPAKAQETRDGTRGRGGMNPFVEFTHKLVYLLKIHPDIGVQAMRGAEAQMRHALDRRIKSEMLRVWRS